MKAVLFDLDDTLYPEIQFVKSGFRTVARYLSSNYQFDEDMLFARMLNILEKKGRGKVFDSLLADLNLYSQDRVKLLVYLYRTHLPAIHLYEDVLPTIERLRSHKVRVGLLTNWMASVQRNKISALGLGQLVDVILCTYELGQDCWKPSATPFRVALELLRVSPLEAAYVGDDVEKDFVGPNSIGMVTLQVKRQVQQGFEQSVISELSRAKFVVHELGDILPIIVERTYEERKGRSVDCHGRKRWNRRILEK